MIPPDLIERTHELKVCEKEFNKQRTDNAVLVAKSLRKGLKLMNEMDKTITSRETYKKQIVGLFNTGDTLYFSEISEKLNIDLKTVVEICKELISEGKIYVKKVQSK